MRKHLLLSIVALVAFASNTVAQNVGIGTNSPHPSAKLEITSSDKGFLAPKVFLTAIDQEAPVGSPAHGLMVFNTNVSIGEGYHYWDFFENRWISLNIQNDKDWLKVSSNEVPQDIEDDIYTLGNVGIGIDFPTSRLHVETNQTGPLAVAKFLANSSNETSIILGNNTSVYRESVEIIYQDPLMGIDNRNLSFKFNQELSPVMLIQADGKVGIGISTPTQRLDVNGALLIRNGNTLSSFTNNQLLFGFNGNATYQHAIKTRHNSGATNGNAIDFYLWNQSTDAINDVGTRQILTLNGNGNVGIGTTNPNNRLQVAAGNGDGILIGNFNDRMGWNGTGAAPEYSIRFAGYRDVVNDFTGAKIASVRTNICCDGLSQGTNLSFQIQPNTATASGDANLVEMMRLGVSGVQVNNLSGTGNRNVYADANGVLRAGTKNVVYLEQRSQQNFDAANVGFRDASNLTPTLAVQAGDVVVINYSAKFAFTGGSGNDDVRFRIQVSGCASTNLEDLYEYEDYDNGRNEYLPVGGNYVWVATCDGNVQFRLQMDSNSDADDNAKLGDVVIVATRY